MFGLMTTTRSFRDAVNAMRTNLLTICLLPVLALSALAVVPAQADDDDDTPAAATMDPNLQWQLADAAWGRREYDDAASLMLAYAAANPNGDNALEALWRAYSVYKSYRPNPDRRKIVFTKGVNLASRWAATYADGDKNRAARAMWYVASLRDQEGDRVLAIAELADLVKRFPGTPSEVDAYWTMAEWMRSAHQCAGAIDNYRAFQKIAGVCENWNVAAFRIGNCYEELGVKDKALQAYASVLDEPKNNWGWWQLGAGAVDAARRSRALGDEDTCKRLATKVTVASPQGGGWADLQRQALQLLGLTPAKKIQVVAGMVSKYETADANISSGARLPVRYDGYLQVRPRYLASTDTLALTLSLSSVADTDSVPANFTKGDDGGYTYSIASPDKDGKVAGDTHFAFGTILASAPVPDGVAVTRRWVKKGDDWGEETIRIQSSAHWRIWVTLPNNKTNPSNISNQPDEVSSDGKTFKWNDKADLSAGITIKFPIETGSGVSEYAPTVRLERDSGRLPEKSDTAKSATAKLPEYGFALASEKPFAYQLTFPLKSVIILDELSK